MNAVQVWGIAIYTLFTFLLATVIFSFVPKGKPGNRRAFYIWVVAVICLLTLLGFLFGRYVIDKL